MRNMKYTIYKEGDQYVSQCLNVDVASCGKTLEEAVANLVEAVELYFEDSNDGQEFIPIEQALIGDCMIHGKTFFIKGDYFST